MDTWNRLTDLRRAGMEETGREEPKNIYACMHSPWPQTTTGEGWGGSGGKGKMRGRFSSVNN